MPAFPRSQDNGTSDFSIIRTGFAVSSVYPGNGAAAVGTGAGQCPADFGLGFLP